MNQSSADQYSWATSYVMV